MPSRSAVSRAMSASAVRALTRVRGPIVLAVSGGLDSMVLLHIAARRRAIKQRCCVATFDHRSGPHATRAVRLVRATAQSFGIPVVSGRAREAGTNEAQWRDMRWRFLRSVAARRGATVVTAHTRDDQVETLVMRVLRGASARGLAALYADSPIVRPLLGVSRRVVELYARDHSVAFAEDPTNADLRYLRNRVRHDLLPACRAVQPDFDRELLALARRAARVRRQTEQMAAQLILPARGGGEETGHRIAIDANVLVSLSGDGLALLWPAFVARLGVPLDRRGVSRATAFALSARPGQAAQCAGGIRLDRTRDAVIVTRQTTGLVSATVRLGPTVEFGGWRLRWVSRAAFDSRSSQQALWGAAIDRIERCSVRAWEPGDRVQALGQSVPRRVKRYFRELAIPVGERQSWPVVVADGQVVWVPGVCLSAAAVEQLGGRPTYLMCERRAG